MNKRRQHGAPAIDMPPERLGELIGRFPAARVAVIGDFFLDKYLDVDPALAAVSAETGKVAHQVVGVRTSPGAAGNVVANLAALCAGALHAFGFTGDDGEGYELRAALGGLGCSTHGLLTAPERMTPTYLKPRDATNPKLSGEHERYDTTNRDAAPPALLENILHALDAKLPELDAVIIVDQLEAEDRGVITAALREALAERARRWSRVVFWADSRVRIRRFRNVIIKANQFEAVGLTDPPPTGDIAEKALLAAAAELRGETGAPVCVTRGARGLLVSDPAWTLVPAVRVAGPVDITGAGDTVSAAAVLALTAGATLPEAALIGALAASISIQQLAVTGAARPEQLPARLELWRAQHIEQGRAAIK